MFIASHKNILKNICIFMAVLAVFVLFSSGDAFAASSEVIAKIRERAGAIIEHYKPIVYILGGFGLIGVAWGAIFGKLNWKWFGNLAIGLFLVAWMGSLIDYFTRPRGQSSAAAMFKTTKNSVNFGDTIDKKSQADSGKFVSLTIDGEQYDFEDTLLEDDNGIYDLAGGVIGDSDGAVRDINSLKNSGGAEADDLERNMGEKGYGDPRAEIYKMTGREFDDRRSRMAQAKGFNDRASNRMQVDGEVYRDWGIYSATNEMIKETGGYFMGNSSNYENPWDIGIAENAYNPWGVGNAENKNNHYNIGNDENANNSYSVGISTEGLEEISNLARADLDDSLERGAEFEVDDLTDGLSIGVSNHADTSEIRALAGSTMGTSNHADTNEISALAGSTMGTSNHADSTEIQALAGGKVGISDHADSTEVQSLAGNKVGISADADSRAINELAGSSMGVSADADSRAVHDLTGSSMGTSSTVFHGYGN